MGLIRPLNEYGEELLELELSQRAKARAAGVCDFCGKAPTTRPCKFIRRHKDPRIATPQQGEL